MSTQIDDAALRAETLAWADGHGHGAWTKLGNVIVAQPGNLRKWAEGIPAMLSRKKIKKIPSALAKLKGGK